MTYLVGKEDRKKTPPGKQGVFAKLPGGDQLYTFVPSALRRRTTVGRPTLSIVLIAAAESLRVMKRFSSSNQKRFLIRLGRNLREVLPVILRPIPFFFFAIPRIEYRLPVTGTLPVT